MTYEAWRISFQSSEQAAKEAYAALVDQANRIRELEASLSIAKTMADVFCQQSHRLESERDAARRELENYPHALKEKIRSAEARIEELEALNKTRLGETRTTLEMLTSALQEERESICLDMELKLSDRQICRIRKGIKK